MIYSVCVDGSSGKYIAFLRDDPSVKAEGMSHAEAVGNLVIAGKLLDFGIEHKYVNED